MIDRGDVDVGATRNGGKGCCNRIELGSARGVCRVRQALLLPKPLQPFMSLSSSTEKASAIVSQIVGAAAGESHDFGELMIQTRYGEGARRERSGAGR